MWLLPNRDTKHYNFTIDEDKVIILFIINSYVLFILFRNGVLVLTGAKAALEGTAG